MVNLIHVPIWSSKCNRYFSMTPLILNCDLYTHFHFPGTSLPQFGVSHIDIAMTHSLAWFESKQPCIKKPQLNIPSAKLQEQSPHSLFWS